MRKPRNVQFMIEGKELYFEKLLAASSVPLFFICKDNRGIRYSVLCTDTFEFKYMLVQSYNEDIKKMLDMEISMRELFNRAVDDVYWLVEVSEEDGSDIITKGSIIDVPREYLPDIDIPYISTDLKYEKIINHDVLYNNIIIIAYKIYITLLFLTNIIFAQEHSNMIIFISNILCGLWMSIMIMKEIKRGGKR